ncbi:M56 family metallopeptidase [Pseudobacteroides cellulosolvens]|uniref:Peptidase M56 BlaR1 n=1 Tax=Pseudobacteroides cellulosolvens ATCC 35603 = DSM 2933 TaxID=398512 RepID=A0A0L6JS73_9FIRM|nr:M56 family metallopeptidase [Pseudobacteroides cellulosolvens]KNY28653.1 peptidase M56 BlaR1 [Pseudobacteroides cellulosolvens ATCC 35603 = DSM 2933]
MIAEALFKWIVCSSVMASILIILLVTLKFALKEKLRASWHHIIWILVVLKLLIPFGPESQLSIYNLFNLTDNRITEESYNVINTISTATSNIAKSTPIPMNFDSHQNTASKHIPDKVDPIYLSIFGLFIWLIGAAIAFSYILQKNIKIIHRLKIGDAIQNKELYEYLEECKKQLKIKRKIILKSVSNLNSPALYGVNGHTLLIPETMLNEKSLWILRYSIYHELAHHKRKDIQINIFISFLLVIHWFNPIIWLGFKKMRHDSELACDELALSYLKPDERKNYGLALIEVAKRHSENLSLANAVCFSSSKSNIRRRLLLVSAYNNKTYKSKFVIGFMFFTLCFIALTNAVESII